MEHHYSSYLQIQKLLSAQVLQTNSDDELLFIIIHQQNELWFKLIIHELDCASKALTQPGAGVTDCIMAFKRLSRVIAILEVLITAWRVLNTLTPDKFIVFRDTVGRNGASGFQSTQYRILEFKLGLKYDTIEFETADGPVRKVSTIKNARTRADRRALRTAFRAVSIYDAVTIYMSRTLDGFTIEDPRNGDYSIPYRRNPAVFEAWRHVYRNRSSAPELYQLGERLIDLEDGLRRWRFTHLATVSRVIGGRAGTGGSIGLRYLQRTANKSFEAPIYPELWEVRDDMYGGGRPAPSVT
jgi:tryptophan 2,3-dioxygenase